MTNEEVIQKITAWQNNPNRHPLTCGNDSSHKPLEPREDQGAVVLTCKDCDYTQKFIPPIVIGTGPGA